MEFRHTNFWWFIIRNNSIFDQPVVVQFYNELTKNCAGVKYGLNASLSLCEKFKPCQVKFTKKNKKTLKKEVCRISMF